MEIRNNTYRIVCSTLFLCLAADGLLLLTENCERHGDCGLGYYCNSGEECADCEQCTVLSDSISSQCPVYCDVQDEDIQCSSHAECEETFYCSAENSCYDCAECFYFNDGIDDNCPDKCVCNSHDECQIGSYCGPFNTCYDCRDCGYWDDAIDGQCPGTCGDIEVFTECMSHEECDAIYYCDSNNKCYYCRECAGYDDAIDGDCPQSCDTGGLECTSHNECAEDQYCDVYNDCYDCAACMDYDDSIDGECPTQCLCDSHTDCAEGFYCDISGVCYECAACMDYDDSVDGDCPESCFCSFHTDCAEGLYCDISGECYECAACMDYNDAVDGGCPESCFCTFHTDCADGLYCDIESVCDDCWSCSYWHDAIDEQCPLSCGDLEVYQECSSHEGCDDEYYCDVNNKCYHCEHCRLHDDAIDGDCQRCTVAECTSNEDCEADSYCSDFFDGLLPAECAPCLICSELNDSIDDVCPPCSGGCFSHEDCGENSYCSDMPGCFNCDICTLFNDPIDGVCPQCSEFEGPVCDSLVVHGRSGIFAEINGPYQFEPGSEELLTFANSNGMILLIGLFDPPARNETLWVFLLWIGDPQYIAFATHDAYWPQDVREWAVYPSHDTEFAESDLNLKVICFGDDDIGWIEPECVDAPVGWNDSMGSDCATYISEQYCTENGDVGSGWQDGFGEFEDRMSFDGNTATQTCCSCGGGRADSDECAFCINGRVGLHSEINGLYYEIEPIGEGEKPAFQDQYGTIVLYEAAGVWKFEKIGLYLSTIMVTGGPADWPHEVDAWTIYARPFDIFGVSDTNVSVVPCINWSDPNECVILAPVEIVVLPDCSYDNPYLGDGHCDDILNTAECAWDGGDCCKDTCQTRTTTCGYNGFRCKAPNSKWYEDEAPVGIEVPLLEAVSLTSRESPAEYHLILHTETSGVLIISTDKDCLEITILQNDEELLTEVSSFIRLPTSGEGEFHVLISELSTDIGEITANVAVYPDACIMEDADAYKMLGDGYCDAIDLNEEECLYDGGDCCSATCSTVFSTCGMGYTYSCKEPDVERTPQDWDIHGVELLAGSSYDIKNRMYPKLFRMHIMLNDEDALRITTHLREHISLYIIPEEGQGDRMRVVGSFIENSAWYTGRYEIEIWVEFAFEMTVSVNIECPVSGDGYCDDVENVPECEWDGGDCCSETCISTLHTCGQPPYNCLDPMWPPSGCSSADGYEMFEDVGQPGDGGQCFSQFTFEGCLQACNSSPDCAAFDFLDPGCCLFDTAGPDVIHVFGSCSYIRIRASPTPTILPTVLPTDTPDLEVHTVSNQTGYSRATQVPTPESTHSPIFSPPEIHCGEVIRSSTLNTPNLVGYDFGDAIFQFHSEMFSCISISFTADALLFAESIRVFDGAFKTELCSGYSGMQCDKLNVNSSYYVAVEGGDTWFDISVGCIPLCGVHEYSDICTNFPVNYSLGHDIETLEENQIMQIMTDTKDAVSVGVCLDKDDRTCGDTCGTSGSVLYSAQLSGNYKIFMNSERGAEVVFNKTVVGYTLTGMNEPNGNFGYVTVVEGNWLFTSDYAADDGGYVASGIIYVYEYVEDSNKWIESSTLRPSDRQDGLLFGVALDIYERTLVVGSAGAVYIFEREEGGSLWNEVQKLTFDSDVSSHVVTEIISEDIQGTNARLFGDDVAIFGNWISVVIENGVCFFHKEVNFWQHTSCISVGQIDWITPDISYVAATNGVVAFSRFVYRPPISSEGTVYIFEQSENDEWVQTETISFLASSSELDHYLKVSLDGEFLVIGSSVVTHDEVVISDGVYIFKRQKESWELVEKLEAPDPEEDAFGIDVAISGNILAVSSPMSGQGFIHFYENIEDPDAFETTKEQKVSNWHWRSSLPAPCCTGITKAFGLSIGLSNGSVVSGDGLGNVAHVFKDYIHIPNPTPETLAIVDPTTGPTSDSAPWYLSFSMIITYIVAGILLLFLILFVVALLRNRDAKNATIIGLGASLADILSDVAFIYEVWIAGFFVVAYISMTSLAISAVVNSILLGVVIRREFQSVKFRDWFNDNAFVASFTFVLSTTNIAVLRILHSKAVVFNKTAFAAPVTKQTESATHYGIASTICEDLPQFCLQMYVIFQGGFYNPIIFVSTFFSFFGLATKTVQYSLFCVYHDKQIKKPAAGAHGLESGRDIAITLSVKEKLEDPTHSDKHHNEIEKGTVLRFTSQTDSDDGDPSDPDAVENDGEKFSEIQENSSMCEYPVEGK